MEFREIIAVFVSIRENKCTRGQDIFEARAGDTVLYTVKCRFRLLHGTLSIL
jgi:hypothetical protein